MRIIKRFIAPKEVKITLNTLDSLQSEFNSQAFKIIHRQIEDGILADCNNVVKQIKNGASPYELVHFAIINFAVEHLESGHYHIYRGILNHLGPGPDFLKLVNVSLNKLQQCGSINKQEAGKKKADLKENIANIG